MVEFYEPHFGPTQNLVLNPKPVHTNIFSVVWMFQFRQLFATVDRMLTIAR